MQSDYIALLFKTHALLSLPSSSSIRTQELPSPALPILEPYLLPLLAFGATLLISNSLQMLFPTSLPLLY